MAPEVPDGTVARFSPWFLPGIRNDGFAVHYRWQASLML